MDPRHRHYRVIDKKFIPKFGLQIFAPSKSTEILRKSNLLKNNKTVLISQSVVLIHIFFNSLVTLKKGALHFFVNSYIKG